MKMQLEAQASLVYSQSEYHLPNSIQRPTDASLSVLLLEPIGAKTVPADQKEDSSRQELSRSYACKARYFSQGLPHRSADGLFGS